MKKKNQKTTNPSETAAAYPDELKALIHSHSVFFDKLVELIPARFYLPPNDDTSDNPKPYFHGLSEAAKASLKRQSKENLKQSRRNRLDPEKIPQSSTLEVLKQSLESNAKTEEKTSGEVKAEDVARSIDFEENQDNEGDGTGSENAGRNTVTYEELRQRLRKKIESLRENRGSGGDNDSNRSNRKGKEVGGNKGRKDLKRKRDGEGSSGKDAASGASKGEEIIEYGKVKLGDDEFEGKKKKKKKKMPKGKELERAKRLAEVKRENPKIAERESWKAAEKRAMGVKVHDDPKLLKESMRKEKKRKEKNAVKWKERVETQKKSKDERLQKRKQNIEGRIHDKKMRKIAKREKKLMRPGFEGRKDEYITKD